MSSGDTSSTEASSQEPVAVRSLGSVLGIDMVAWRQASPWKRIIYIPKEIQLDYANMDDNSGWYVDASTFIHGKAVNIPLMVPVGACGLVAAVLVMVFTRSDCAPRGHHIFSWMALFSSFGWSYHLCHRVIFSLKIILEAKDLLSITDGSEVKPEIEDIAKFSNWKKKDAKSKMLITTALEFKYLQQIVNCQTSAEMWKKLSTIYELKSETNKYLLQQRFFEYKMNPNDNIASHISKVEIQAQQLKDLAWDSVSSEEKTLENLTARLLKEESLQDHWDSSGNFKPDNALMTFQISTEIQQLPKNNSGINNPLKITHIVYIARRKDIGGKNAINERKNKKDNSQVLQPEMIAVLFQLRQVPSSLKQRIPGLQILEQRIT
ncbi:hypothetical protein LAZ67_8003295 [Cordylochernes scorpioides]|uniref:Uncharacterized protein n=1 Tax=Cordylochernes scorpioides TaxID=51811 RepID=A0ABY6KT21_9ARAC|nr:hypothetical protein LAZ67_8003295 [Cordylochernes scorpioides]